MMSLDDRIDELVDGVAVRDIENVRLDGPGDLPLSGFIDE